MAYKTQSVLGICSNDREPYIVLDAVYTVGQGFRAVGLRTAIKFDRDQSSDKIKSRRLYRARRSSLWV
jgi:hypothetical protein